MPWKKAATAQRISEASDRLGFFVAAIASMTSRKLAPVFAVISLSQAQYSGSNAKLVWWPKMSIRRCFIEPLTMDDRESSESQKPATPKTENDQDLELYQRVQ